MSASTETESNYLRTYVRYPTPVSCVLRSIKSSISAAKGWHDTRMSCWTLPAASEEISLPLSWTGAACPCPPSSGPPRESRRTSPQETSTTASQPRRTQADSSGSCAKRGAIIREMQIFIGVHFYRYFFLVTRANCAVITSSGSAPG